MFIGKFSEFQVLCGTDLIRSTYYTCSDIHITIVTCYKWLSLKFVTNLCFPDAVVLINRSQGDSIEFTLNYNYFEDFGIQSTSVFPCIKFLA